MAVGGPSTSYHVNDIHQTAYPSVRTSSSRCTQCSLRPKENTKNLVVCIDGTSNQFGQNNTNVVKLFGKIDLETIYPEQHAFYSSGVSTRPKSSHIFNRLQRAVSDKFDMAIVWNTKEIVKEAYSWLAEIYQEGDQIYLFGFSRGAYQVRELAGMIHEIGLIKDLTKKPVETAYDHYEALRSGKLNARQDVREFKDKFSWQGLRVHFIGVWDTVSSMGLVRGDVFLSTSSSAVHACHFRHALALDERRVKFMPEYFHEMNSQTNEGKSKYIVSSPDVEHAANATIERPVSTISDYGTHFSDCKKTTEIKEVWFAGNHSDVGGTSRPGESHQAGNVSLLWMRREAIASGLVLKPADLVWVPDDLDFGTSASMSHIWRAMEYVPIKHQVSFSGTGKDARRLHRFQPRRIIPGQKVHASVLYANAYKPKATFGEGFDIPIVKSGLKDTELDSDIWETGFFDDTAAQELLTHLSSPQGVAPIYLDKLLFMLRFNEGKKCVRSVSGWQDTLMNLIRDRSNAAFVRLATIVAYYEASCEHAVRSDSRAPLDDVKLPEEIFDDAKKCVGDVLAQRKYGDGPRVVALLGPLTKHQKLRECILTKDVLETLVILLDKMVAHPEGNFGRAMDGLTCLLQCDDTRQIIVEKLSASPKNSNVSRLSLILKVEKPHLAAALRMMLTLARISEARTLCSQVKPRIEELARKDGGLVGLLAVEVFLVLYHHTNDRGRLDIRDARVRANLSGALVRLNPDGCDAADGQDPEQQIFREIFPSDIVQLSDPQRTIIGELKKTVQKGNVRERTAATMTLLKLCEIDAIRSHLRSLNLLHVFINQLQRKESALLAAYALVTCLRYHDMKELIENDDELPKHIVEMLRLNYFDDAVGHVEGFQIFGDLMQHTDLREKIMKSGITRVLDAKLGKGKQMETRTSLICLEIFRFFDESGPWTDELVANSLVYLRDPVWKVQKAGVTVLSALAQTEPGVTAIKSRIHEIVEMLLPDGYLPMQSVAPQATPGNPALLNEDQTQLAATTSDATDAQSFILRDTSTKPPSWMMGPACALRILGRNKTLRDKLNETIQYSNLKHLYLGGILVDGTDTSPWRVRTPNLADVNDMLDKMIKVVDGELSEESLMSIDGAVLPHIQHWDRLVMMFRDQALARILPLLGVSVMAALALIVASPIYASVRVYDLFKQMRSRYQDTRILNNMRNEAPALTVAPGSTVSQLDTTVKDVGELPGPSVESSHTQIGEDTQLINPTSQE